MSTAPFDSSTVICGKTALAYYRTPPRYLAICPPLPHEVPRSTRPELHASPLAADVLGFPLHVLANDRANRSQTRTFRHHVLTEELPFASKRETPHGFRVTSPELTLFTLSRSLTFNQLVMVAYEFCGRFTLFAPPPALEAELAARSLTDAADGWTRVADPQGKPIGLWMRPPFTTVRKLEAFVRGIEGLRGAKLFARAIDCVSGVCASPFEAQLSMLLYMRPSQGGWGIRTIESNFRITLDESARVLTGKKGASVDLRILSPDGMREWMIECQGRVIHDRIGVGTADSLRATALQSMGYHVTLVAYDQIADTGKFSVLMRMLADNLQFDLPRKTTRQTAIEDKLRAEIFSDWAAIANEPPAPKKRRGKRTKERP